MNKIIFRFIVASLLLFNHLAYSIPPPWIDIPNDNYGLIAPKKNESFHNLDKLVKEYHKIPKEKKELVVKRIESLKRIVCYLEICIKNEKSKIHFNFLNNILKIARNKLWYLNELHERQTKKEFSHKKLTAYHSDLTGLKSTYTPLILYNKRMYDSSNGQYWGEYWMETIDPCHRQLTPYYELWKTQRKGGTLDEFFLWLETQTLSKDVPYLGFLSNEELAQIEVQAQDGLMYRLSNGEKKIVNYCNNKTEYIFNISIDEKLYLTPATKTVHHVSISHGKPVLGCGNMRVCDGKIIEIQLESGH